MHISFFSCFIAVLYLIMYLFDQMSRSEAFILQLIKSQTWKGLVIYITDWVWKGLPHFLTYISLHSISNHWCFVGYKLRKHEKKVLVQYSIALQCQLIYQTIFWTVSNITKEYTPLPSIHSCTTHCKTISPGLLLLKYKYKKRICKQSF